MNMNTMYPFPQPVQVPQQYVGQQVQVPGQYGQGAKHAELVDRIKRGQRASMEWKQRWWSWCDANGGTRDPVKHDTFQLMQAVAQCGEPPMGPAAQPVAQYKKTRRPQPQYDPAHANLVSLIKRGQRASADWKVKWWKWCDEQGGSTYDPMRHPAAHLSRAVDAIGYPPLDETQNQPAPVATSPQHQELIEKVKALQRSSMPFKTAWGKYCETNGEGKRDPARHHIDFIQTAMDHCIAQTGASLDEALAAKAAAVNGAPQ